MPTLIQKSATIFVGGLFIGPSANTLQLVSTVTLTPANIAAMHGSPVSILPAPPSGFLNFIEYIMVQYKYGTAVFSGGGAINFVYHGTSTSPHTGTISAYDSGERLSVPSPCCFPERLTFNRPSVLAWISPMRLPRLPAELAAP